MFKRVRQSVQQQTRGEQVPWEASSLVGEFVFAVPAAAPASGRLEGTTWHGRSSAGDAYEVVFEAGGRLRFTPLLGTRTTSRGTWGQKGDLVYFEINNGHSESSGIRRGGVIEGTGRNVTGQTWTWTFTRTRAE